MDDIDLIRFKLNHLGQALEIDFFSETNVEGEIPLLDKIKAMLTEAIVYLLDRDRDRLMSILYQIDIAEGKTRQALAVSGRRNQAGQLAEAIVERHLKKLRSRQKYWEERNREYGESRTRDLPSSPEEEDQ